MVGIVDEVFNNLQQTLAYETQGFRARWERRKKLVQDIRSKIQQYRPKIFGETITPKGKIHYGYETVVTEKGVHY